MKTYDSERTELYEWLKQQQAEYSNAFWKAAKEKRVHRDSEANRKYKEAVREYNKKLLALKGKYGVK